MSGIRYTSTTSTGVAITYTCKCGVVIQCAGDKLLEKVVSNHLTGKIHADSLTV